MKLKPMRIPPEPVTCVVEVPDIEFGSGESGTRDAVEVAVGMGPREEGALDASDGLGVASEARDSWLVSNVSVWEHAVKADPEMRRDAIRASRPNETLRNYPSW